MHHLQRLALGSGTGLTVLSSIYFGLAYFVFEWHRLIASIGFLALVPAGMGAATVLFRDEDQLKNYFNWLFAPWMAMMAALILLFVIGREAAVCIIMILSPLFVFGMVGSLIGWIVVSLITRSRKKRRAAGIMSILLPFAFMAFEQRYLMEEQEVVVRSSMVIASDADAIWSRLANFSAIEEDELPPSVFDLLGIPRPIEARSEFEGLGARRTGYFENGLQFDEVIITYDRPRELAFSVDVDPTGLSTGSLERHAFEHGYFRFVDARYRLEQRGPRQVEVSLVSRYRLRTSVNPYGILWADAITADFQDRVLAVLKQRAERDASVGRWRFAENEAFQ